MQRIKITQHVLGEKLYLGVVRWLNRTRLGPSIQHALGGRFTGKVRNFFHERPLRRIKVTQVNVEQNIPGILTYFGLDSPKSGDVFKGSHLSIVGCAVGTEKSAWKLSISWNAGRAIAPPMAVSSAINSPELDFVVVSWGAGRSDVPISLSRPALADRYGQSHPWAAQAGFRTQLAFWRAAGLVDLEFSVHVGQDIVPVGRITCQVEVHRPAIRPRFNPVMITALGRSGTTLCMHALAHHPEIVVSRVYPYETRTAQHFMSSLHYSLEVGRTDGMPPTAEVYLSHDFVGSTTEHYMNCIDQFYAAVAQANGQPEARYFAEKFASFVTQGWFYDLYPKAKEVILVRDFRDVFCSVLAFNAKRGIISWGRDRYNSDVEYAHAFGKAVDRLCDTWRINAEHALLVRYEDLVLRPEETVARLFEYLEVDASPSLVKEICNICAQPTGKLREHMTSSSSQDSIGRWRSELSSDVQAAVHEAFGDALVEFGYQIDS